MIRDILQEQENTNHYQSLLPNDDYNQITYNLIILRNKFNIGDVKFISSTCVYNNQRLS